jgi:hypothetical protein
MKSLVIALAVMLVSLFVVSFPSYAAERADEQLPLEGMLSEDRMVKVMNLDPISNRNRSFKFGERCALRTFPNVYLSTNHHVILVAQDGDRVLVRYEYPFESGLGKCPSGALFFVPLYEYIEAAARCYGSRCVERERRHIQQLLQKAERE